MLDKRKIKTKYSEFLCVNSLVSVKTKQEFLYISRKSVYQQSGSHFKEAGCCLLYKVFICLASLIYEYIIQRTPPHLDLFCVIC